MPQELWRSAAECELVWAHWGEGHAVHHRPSGRTHLVDSLMFTLLDDLLREPRTLEEAAAALALRAQTFVDDAALTALADVFGRLEALGLVRREVQGG